MKLSRRSVLSCVGAAIAIGSLSPVIGRDTTIDGYLKPYGIANRYLFSKTPFHCLDCFNGQVGDLVVVHLNDQASYPSGKVRLSGVLIDKSNKNGLIPYALHQAQFVKKAFV